jgi:hypothetical protein
MKVELGKRKALLHERKIGGCALPFPGDIGMPSKSEGKIKKEEYQPPLRAKVGATLVPSDS